MTDLLVVPLVHCLLVDDFSHEIFWEGVLIDHLFLVTHMLIG